MPEWLNRFLMWGGCGLVVVFAVALIWVESAAAPVGGTEGGAPTVLYWVLLVVGAVAAIAGYYLERRSA